jgi:hypothetical protein
VVPKFPRVRGAVDGGLEEKSIGDPRGTLGIRGDGGISESCIGDIGG